jgi:DNA-binding PadR family transcriptional regulator
MAELTTTSYAILGLLNLRPHTAYELAAQSQRSLRFAWPTAPSRLYAEPKRLAELGLIRIGEQAAGPVRTRQVYRITRAGRRVLRDWLKTPPAPLRLDAEVLLRMLFADAGSSQELISALHATRDQVLAEYADGMEYVRQYSAGDVAYPERMHLNLIWMTFVAEFLQLANDWAVFAEEETGSWHKASDRGRTQRAEELLNALEAGRRVIDRQRLPEQ